ncbi:MAG: NAD-dependent epimerase/dehydratase family protein [Gemmatimonadota bacterium]|nr:NAD-dependent epimerase/dehydratase family protein [Gemmatimonadota bacterium]
MRILVTGGTGFTGAALVERLLGLGHEVVSLDYQPGRREAQLRDMGAEIVRGSVTEREVVARCMEGVDVVHHVAAAFRELDVPRQHYDDVNVGGARIVLDEAVRCGVKRFVNCSTCGVHGNVEHPPADEDAPIAPADYYQRTKYEAEPIVTEYSQRHGLSAITLRPAAIYGPGDPERFYMIFRRVASGTFPMFGSGRTTYHPVYIDNLVDAFLLAQDSDISGGRPYLIADENYYPIEQIVIKVGEALGIDVRIPHYPVMPLVAAGYVCEAICKPFGISPPIFPRRVDWFRQNRAFDITRARTELGYVPAVGLDEGLRRTGEWYKAEGMLSVD